MSGILQVFYAIFSGILTSLALPNEIFKFGSPIFGFFALCPLYVAAKNAKSYKKSAFLFFIDAITTHFLSSFWLCNFGEFAIFTLGASALGTACIEAVAGNIFFAAMGHSPNYHAIFFACVRVIYEWAKSTGFLAYPWGTLSMSAFRSKILLQSADIFGTYGITFLFAFSAAVIGEWILCGAQVGIFFKALRQKCALKKIKRTQKILNYCGKKNSAKNFELLPLLQMPLDSFDQNDKIRFVHCCFNNFNKNNNFNKFINFNNFNKFNKFNNFWHTSFLSMFKCLVFLYMGFFLYGTFRILQVRTPVKFLNAVLVQQNKNPWDDSNEEKTLQTSMELSEKGIEQFANQGQKTDIVVWSEAVLHKKFPNNYAWYATFPQSEPLINFIRRMRAPFLIGGSYVLDEENSLHANSALMFDEKGFFRGYYAKIHLVPFAEVIPYIDHPFVKSAMDSLVHFSHSWTPGNEFTVFDIESHSEQKKIFPSFSVVDMTKSAEKIASEKTKIRIATPICFEDAFPDVCGPFHKFGTEVFLNITNDSWSQTQSAEYQHFVVAAFRAVEYRTTLVRSTNSGFTCVVDPCGRILQSIELFEENFMCAKIPIFRFQETVFSRYTNWFVHIVLILIAARLCFCARENFVWLKKNRIICALQKKSLQKNATQKMQNFFSLKESIKRALDEITILE